MVWKMKTLIVPLVAVLLIGLAVVMGSLFARNAISDTPLAPIPSSLRPDYCIEGFCANKMIFSELPPYPSNFADVKILTYPEPYLGMFENFSNSNPDESYWKQPEFYGNSWEEQWLRYYTTDDVKFRCCSGPYPGDQMVSNLTVGDTYRLVTYWHAGPAIFKYQAIRLTPTYPGHGKMRMGTEEVTQDPDRTKSCMETTVSPDTILMEPTFPKFYYDWTRKITLDITPRCSGRYFITMIPDSPDPEFMRELIREHGLNMVSTIVSGGIWNILLVVN